MRVPVHGAPEVEAVCLDPHDTCSAKLARNEERDRVFVRALVDAGLIDPLLVAERINAIPEVRLEMTRKRVVLTFVRSLEPR